MNRVITQATGKKLAQDLKAAFFETSAKDNHCANDLFSKAIIQIEKVYLESHITRAMVINDQCISLQIEGNGIDDPKKGCVVA